MSDDPLIGATFYFTAKPQVDDAPRGGNGSQVLPVADLGDDFDGEPEDGMEYLFLVRREAATHAKVYRASLNPYDADESSAPPGARTKPRPERNHSSRPSEEWRRAFVEKFKATRFRMATLPSNSTSSFRPADPSLIPAPRQESAWRIFVNGKRSKPVKPPPPRPTTKGSTSTVTAVVEDRDTEMKDEDDLESAKAAVLASLELDTPDEPRSSTSTPASTFVRALPHAASSSSSVPLGAPTSTTTPAPPERPVLPAVAVGPEFDKLPQLPTPAVVAAVPATAIVDVLGHFTAWFSERLDAYHAALEWVPSTIFAPPALRRKPAASASAAGASSSFKGGATSTNRVEKASERNHDQDNDAETTQTRKRGLVAPLPSPHEVHWILSLVARVDDLLDGDDLSNLRQLAKTVVDMVEASEKAAAAATTTTSRAPPPRHSQALGGARSQEESLEEKRRRRDAARDAREEEDEARARCWMIVAAIAGVWKQEDLWNVNL
ncbi:hypothetical protein JCM11491_000112 [Sporobolomyces phaffii]